MNVLILTKKIIFKPSQEELIVLNSFAYASAKLWNIANYEKRNYEELGFDKFPDWYDQKKRLKSENWYQSLPSQTAQDVLDKLHKSWKSFFVLKETGGVQNPKPPRFKKDGFNFSFLNNGYKVIDDHTVRFAISKRQKEYLKSYHAIDLKYLTLEINNFSKVNGKIKIIEFKPVKNNQYQINVAYEIPDVELVEDNKHCLSIDIGISNLFTCYDNSGISFIVKGGKYLEISQYFNKKIAHYQKIANSQQVTSGSKYGKSTKKINSLYEKKNLQLHHFFHCATKKVVDYCIKNDISKVIIGDMTGIRENANLGKVNNQKFHGLPYGKIYSLLEYKLKKQGIALIKQKEHYSSQVSPFAPRVDQTNATKNKRKHRGLYIDKQTLFNADSVGAFNILRLYEQKEKTGLHIPLKGLSDPVRLNVSM